MTDEKKTTKKATSKKCVALKNLCTAKDGNVKKGGNCTCTAKEYEVLSVDENGYLNGVGAINPTSIIIDKQDRPIDFDKGYYNYIDGEYVIDEERKLLLSGGVI